MIIEKSIDVIYKQSRYTINVPILWKYITENISNSMYSFNTLK